MSFTQPQQTHPSGLVSTDAVLEYLGALLHRDGRPMEYRTLMRWIKFADLPSHKVGKTRVFDLAEVDAWMRSEAAQRIAS